MNCFYVVDSGKFFVLGKFQSDLVTFVYLLTVLHF